MYKRQKFITLEQAQIHTKASDFIKGTCGLYQIQDDAKYIINGTNTRELMNKKIKEIIQYIKKDDREME